MIIMRYAVMEHYYGDLIGVFNNLSSVKKACIGHAKKYNQEGGISHLEFRVYQITLTNKNRVKTYIAEFTGIELSEIDND